MVMALAQLNKGIKIIVLSHYIPHFLAASQAAMENHPPLLLVVIHGDSLHKTLAFTRTITGNKVIDMSRRKALTAVIATATR